jgi:hypothetical protein
MKCLFYQHTISTINLHCSSVKYYNDVMSWQPVERLCSKAAIIPLTRRNMLSDKNFEMQLLLTCNKAIARNCHWVTVWTMDSQNDSQNSQAVTPYDYEWWP